MGITVYLCLIFDFGLLSLAGAGTTCGGDLTATGVNQTFTSPNYPHAYTQNITCTWRIRATDNTTNVRVTGQNINITNANIPGCFLDQLIIYDGSSSDNEIDRVCGFHSSLVRQTFSDVMTLVFETKQLPPEFNSRGFSLAYIQTNENPPCDFKYTANYRQLNAVTPGFPQQYRTNDRCTFTIDCKSQLKIEFLVTSISTNCSTDHVSVYEGDSASSPLIGRFCGTETPSFLSNGKIFVEFISGPTVNGSGFKFRYEETVDQVCQYTSYDATTEPGYITSPNYPFMYAKGVECTWVILCDAGYRIVLDVLMADIEKTPDCKNDWVAVYDGPVVSYPVLGFWCGNETDTYRGTTFSLVVLLHSNKNDVTGMGFRMKYYTEDRNSDLGPKVGPKVGAIVGGVVGGLLVIVIIVIVVVLLIRATRYTTRPTLKC